MEMLAITHLFEKIDKTGSGLIAELGGRGNRYCLPRAQAWSRAAEAGKQQRGERLVRFANSPLALDAAFTRRKPHNGARGTNRKGCALQPVNAEANIQPKIASGSAGPQDWYRYSDHNQSRKRERPSLRLVVSTNEAAVPCTL